MSFETLLLISVSFLLISCMYSLAGLGGGSSYLATLSLVFHDMQVIRTTALACNIAVVGMGCFIAYKNGKLQMRSVIPYAILSVPAAFFGARVQLTENVFFIILGITLVLAAMALLIQTDRSPVAKQTKSPWLSSFSGGGIGFLSGMVGIGGGIFLSPILNLFRWETAHQASHIARFFVLINSLAGLASLTLTANVKSSMLISCILIVSVLMGGYAGTRINIKKLNASTIKKITGVLVLIVGTRLLFLYCF